MLIRQQILRFYSGALIRRANNDRDGRTMCVHTLLHDMSEFEADHRRLRLPIGTIRMDDGELWYLLDSIREQRPRPSAFKALDNDGLVPALAAAKLNLPVRIVFELLRFDPEVILGI